MERPDHLKWASILAFRRMVYPESLQHLPNANYTMNRATAYVGTRQLKMIATATSYSFHIVRRKRLQNSTKREEQWQPDRYPGSPGHQNLPSHAVLGELLIINDCQWFG